MRPAAATPSVATSAPPRAAAASSAVASAPRISAEQRSRAAAMATEHARPEERSPQAATQATQPAPAMTSRALAPAQAPPRAVRPVAAAVKPAVPTPARLPSSAAAPAHFSLTSERVRERMVERVRANGVSDPRVLAAMAAVPRHLFVDPGFATQAYEEAALPIGHHQTISKPSVVARMIELAANGRVLDNVLEIGTGCGYQAAVLSGMARDVYSIERIRPLYERAKQNLRPLRIPNIRLHYGDGRLGMPNVAPFDAIVIAAAGLDVPQALLEQLQIGGRLVAPVGAESQVLTLVERVAENQWHESQLDRVFFVPLKSGVI
ncbi:MAG TPA: protein-L-isoaspartate(D-aspartate) O-methyltransferase [Pararobbsia sp.]|nr:protein-L-isoaspartate(D-aspartate) O-methyltransferase [Pararobbsia sp.]